MGYPSFMTERELALWDRSRGLASFHLHAVAMQIARVRNACEAPDEQFVLRPRAIRRASLSPPARLSRTRVGMADAAVLDFMDAKVAAKFVEKFSCRLVIRMEPPSTAVHGARDGRKEARHGA